MKLIIKIFIILIVGQWLYGFCVIKKDIILEKTPDYIYVKKYSWYNKDSTIYKYKAEQLHKGVVIDKRINKIYKHTNGSGRRWETQHEIIINYNNTNQIFKSSKLYNLYNKGDTVKLKEEWYPTHSLNIIY